jgi:hypothetical protein
MGFSSLMVVLTVRKVNQEAANAARLAPNTGHHQRHFSTRVSADRE